MSCILNLTGSVARPRSLGGLARRIGRTSVFSAAVVLLTGVCVGQNSTPHAETWVTDNAVLAAVRTTDTVYIGGDFTNIGPYTGPGVPVDTDTGLPVAGFPRVNDVVHCCVPDGAGGFFIGGSFTKVGDVTRNRIAHILADGTLDPAWNPNANDSVGEMCLSGSTLYVSGSFGNIGGASRNCMAALDAATGLATAWNPNAGFGISAIAAHGNTVYVGGDFLMTGGTEFRMRLAALDATSGAVLDWNPGADAMVNALAVSADGSTVYAGGYFETIGGATRYHIAALDPGTSFATAWNPSLNGEVNCLITSGTRLYAGGRFTKVNGLWRSYVADLDTVTTSVSTWAPMPSGGAVFCMQTTGTTIYIGGEFTTVSKQRRNRVAAIDTLTTALLPWDPRVSREVTALAVSETMAYLGGPFSSVGVKDRNHIAAVDVATGEATDWAPSVESISSDHHVYDLEILGSTLYVAGAFSAINGEPRSNIAALDLATGAAKPWNPGANGSVLALEITPSAAFVGGNFTTAGGQPRNNLAALDIATSEATSWNPGADGQVNSLLHAGSVVYAGGRFINIGGQQREYLAALDAASGTAASWYPKPNGYVEALALPGTTLFAGGSFSECNEIPRVALAAWDTASGNLAGWNANLTGALESIAVLDDTVYVAGELYSVGGLPRTSVAGIDLATGIANSWAPDLSWEGNVILPSVSSVYVGGHFTSVGDEKRCHLAQFDSPNADLALTKKATPTTASLNGALTWTIDVLNRGPMAADSVILSDVLPPGMTFAAARTTRGTVNHSAGTVTADLQTMAAGDEARVTIEVSAVTTGPATNVATVSSTTPDPDLTNNSASADAAITASDVSVWRDWTFITDITNPTPGGTTGWVPFRSNQPEQTADYDTTNTALRVSVASSTAGPRMNGWMTANAEWMPYGEVGSASIVRGRFHIFRSGQLDASDFNQIPNMRMRLSNRFAVTSMLEVFNHLAGDSAGTSAGMELRPSSDPEAPSVYRVDFDPVDVPALNTAGEGISCAFEAYCLESQENGAIELAEVVVGTYPASLLPDTGPQVISEKVFQCSASDAGDLKVVNSATDGPFLSKYSLFAPGVVGPPVALDGVTDPAYAEGSLGISLDTTAVASNRLGIAVREFTAMGAYSERMRVEPGRQYKVRWHMTSSANANRNPQVRMRSRCLKFMWSQKLEIGGSLSAGSMNNQIAQQALPGVGTANPDQQTAGENGGWYTLLMHTPLSSDIQQAQVFIGGLPGPGADTPSMRDVMMGLDLLDTLSASSQSGRETGSVRLDRIELRAYGLVQD